MHPIITVEYHRETCIQIITVKHLRETCTASAGRQLLVLCDVQIKEEYNKFHEPHHYALISSARCLQSRAR